MCNDYCPQASRLVASHGDLDPTERKRTTSPNRRAPARNSSRVSIKRSNRIQLLAQYAYIPFEDRGHLSSTALRTSDFAEHLI
jgi:hypothetical protein